MDNFINNYDDWVNLAGTFVPKMYAKDIVQEAFIKLSAYESQNFNRSYIYLTIRSLCLDFLKAKNKIHKEPIENFDIQYNTEIETKKTYDLIIDKIENEIESWTWYDKELFKIYKNTPLSLRKISHETGISLTSIHITIKKCKEILKDKFKEDYEDYLNEDYERI